MAKRRADKQLTEDNWQNDDESEEECATGSFKRASDDVLAKRVIKTAKRRTAETSGSSESPSLGVFKSFGGFGTTGSTSFNFGSKTETTPKLEATSFKPQTTGNFSFGQKNCAIEMMKPIQSPVKTNGEENKAPVQENGSGSAEGNNKAYLASLRALNQGVLEFIQKHLTANTNINLTPVFDDYKEHFEQLEATHKPKFSNKSETNTENGIGSNGHVSPEKVVAKAPPSFSMGCSDKDKENSPSPATKPEKSSPIPTSFFKPMVAAFGSSPSTAPKESSAASFSFSATAKPFAPETFSFGKKSEASTESKPSLPTFSFGGGNAKPLTFGAKDGFSFASSASTFSFGGSIPAPQSSATASNSTEEDYAPPKAEVLEVKEEGSVFDIKCKLFYKNEGNFTEKGVGTLFLKPVENSSRTQLIVRAATSLGNVLLNIILQPKMPAQKTGKNNVMIICVPNPPIDTKAETVAPVTFLIRVKTEENALELLKQIQKHQGVLIE